VDRSTAVREVNNVDRGQYLAVMAACLVVTAPLEFVFSARVYRRPRRTLRAVLPVLVVFYVWDAVAIDREHWWFDERYVTGWTLPLGVPFDELTFFVVIPLCVLLSYESVRNILDGKVGWLPIGRRSGVAGGPPTDDRARGA
jgi:lycopene cyclase domain-containing protein